VLLHAVADFVTSTGTRVEGVGVIPDTEAKLTRSGLLAGKDEVFESAAAWIVERTIASRAEKAESAAKSAGGS
jgi:C-terminal processing protease CtpA/Prc